VARFTASKATCAKSRFVPALALRFLTGLDFGLRAFGIMPISASCPHFQQKIQKDPVPCDLKG
jgi:hypothetical protein